MRLVSGVVVVVFAGACGSQAGTANPSRSAPAPPEPAAARSLGPGGLTADGTAGGLAPTGGGWSAATAWPRANAAPCTAALRLSVETRRGDQSIGQAVGRLVLRNVGAATCAVRGYPAVSLLDAAFRPMPVRIHRTGAGVATVSLRPGEAAEALIETSELPGRSGGCAPQSAYVAVRLDGWTRTLTVRDHVPRCGGDLRVNPLRGR